MLNYTINGSKCQELFLSISNPVYDAEGSYYRRKDISLSERIEIAVNLLEREGQYGVVTSKSLAYSVSRTFLYDIRETARVALEMSLSCGQPGRPSVSSFLSVDKNRVERGIVTLATVGCCSIGQTRKLLKELLDVECSVGYISGILQKAEERATQVNDLILPSLGIKAAADEIFDGGVPHFVIVEPNSLMILELSRQKNRDSLTWGITFLDCAKIGLDITKVVSVGAQGLKKGIAEAELGIEHQLDLFHTIREILRVEKQLEREAYRAMKVSAERELVVYSARSDKVFEKRFKQWIEASFALEHKIWVYEIYSWLAKELREGLEFVDLKSGDLRSREAMSALIETVSALMCEIPNSKVQSLAERLDRQKSMLVKYLEPLQEELDELKRKVGDDKLVQLCLKEWRLSKETTRPGLSKRVLKALEACREQLRGFSEEIVKQVKQTVQWLFGKVVRASSLVETVNSWLRPFLWRRKGNGRGIFSLLRLCWNTHRFERGKRQGFTPIKLAGIEVNTDDWLELLGFAPKS